MQNNPAGQAKAETNTPCGLVRLLLIMTYDSIIVLGLLLIAAALASPFDSGNQRALRDPGFSLYLLTIWFMYLAVCWRFGGMTVGMRAWKSVLHSESGQLTWLQCLVRFLVSLASAACAGLGFAWILVDRQKRSWHDMASKTCLRTRKKSHRAA